MNESNRGYRFEEGLFNKNKKIGKAKSNRLEEIYTMKIAFGTIF
jgi:hypothetical protein